MKTRKRLKNLSLQVAIGFMLTAALAGQAIAQVTPVPGVVAAITAQTFSYSKLVDFGSATLQADRVIGAFRGGPNHIIIAGERYNGTTSEAFFATVDQGGNPVSSAVGVPTNGLSFIEDITKSADGGFLVVGLFQSSPGNFVSQLVKFDALGNEQWFLLGSSQSDQFKATLPTPDGGCLLLKGWPGGGASAVRVDGTGTILWSTNPFSSAEIPRAVADGSTAYVLLATDQIGQVRLIKINALGAFQWSVAYPSLGSICIGRAIERTAAGEFVVVGACGNTPQDAFVMKASSTGALLWNRTLGIPAHAEYLADVKNASGGGIVALGLSAPNGAFFWERVYFVGLDTNGNLQIEHKQAIPGASPNIFAGKQRMLSLGDGYVFGGGFFPPAGGSSDSWFVRTNVRGLF